MDADTDSDDVPRYLHPDRVRRPLADYAPGYDMVANKIQKDAIMRAIGTVWRPERRLQCLGSAAIFFKEDLTMGSGYEVDGTRMGEQVVASPRTKALQMEEILVGLRNTLSEGIATKAKQFLNLTRNNNNEDLLAQRHGGKPRCVFRGHDLRSLVEAHINNVP